MNISYNSQSNPNFQARLNFNKIKIDDIDKAQLTQKLFASKTAHYKNGQLDLTRGRVERDNGSFFHNVDVTSEEGDLGFICNMKDFNKWFNESPAEDLANQLAHLYKLGKLRLKNVKNERKILRNMASTQMSLLNNRGRIEAFKSDGNLGAVDQWQGLVDSQTKRLKTLKDTLSATVDRNTKLEDSVAENLSPRIYFSPEIDR